MINHSNIEGAASFAGGTQRLADALAEVLRAAGGELLCDARASRLHLSGGSVCTVELNDGEQQLETRWVISDIAPAATFALVDPTPLLRRSFLHRMESLPYTYGLFTAHVRVRPGALPYRNCNHYLYNTPDVWSEQGDFEGCNIPVVLLCMQPSAEEPTQADVVTLMVPMRIQPLEPWFGTRSGRRGADYEAFKRRFAERTLRFAARFFPGLDRGAELLCTSTPLTYLDLTGSPEGSAYGLQKDFNRPVSSLIPVRSRIANLLLTGQNLNVHGMLGVTLSAALTCSELVGEAYLAKKIGYA